MRYTSQRGLGYTRFMRKIFFLILVAVLINPVAAVRAQEETKASDSAADTGGTAQKKIGKKRNYTTFDTEESQQKTETSKSGNGKSTSGSGAGTQTCTDHARAKAEEYDKLMIAYYEDSQLIAQNQQKLETTKEIEELQKNMQVYMDFMGSEDYKEAVQLHQLCGMPMPPRPFEWPEWMGMPDPFGSPSPAAQ